MQHNLIQRNYIARLAKLYIFVSLFFVGIALADSGKEKLYINIDSQSQPFEKVVEDISIQLQYDFEVDEELLQVPISGRYIKIPLDEFINKKLKKNNVSVVRNDKDRKIYIKCIGKKNNVAFVSVRTDGHEKSAVELDVEKGKNIRSQQEKALGGSLPAVTAVDSESADNLSEIRSIHKRQNKILEVQKNEGTGIEPITGISVAEIEEIHKKQSAAIVDESDR